MSFLTMNGTTISDLFNEYIKVKKLLYTFSVLIGIIFIILIRKLHRLWFAYMIYTGGHIIESALKDKKSKLFERLEELDMKKEESGEPLRILEIGSGSGANFAFYPKGTQLTIVEPLYEVKKYFLKNLALYPQIELTDYHVRKVEDMDNVSSGQYDVIVATMVLCSVRVKKALKQMCRVLKPNGLYFFEEHIRAWDWPRLFVQSLLSPLWCACFDGCCLIGQPHLRIASAGFDVLEMDYYYANFPDLSAFEMVKPHVQGVARKSSGDSALLSKPQPVKYCPLLQHKHGQQEQCEEL